MVGQIKQKKNDTRHRSSDSLIWAKAKEDQQIRIGDSVFAGDDSFVLVQLQDGGELTVNKNSMVNFREIQDQKLANLNWGNFRLKVQGQLKLAVRGQVIAVNGASSEVLVTLDPKQAPKIKLLKGNVKIKQANSPKEWALAQTEQLAVLDIPPDKKVAKINNGNELPVPQVVPPPVVPAEVPGQLSAQNEPLIYTWKLYDLYKQDGFQLIEHEQEPDSIPLTATLSWADGKGKDTYVELSNQIDFKNSSTMESSQGFVTTNTLHMGENFWRISYDKKNWSEAQTLFVRSSLLPNARPDVKLTSHEILLVGDKANTMVSLKAPVQALGYVLEAAREPIFVRGRTRIFWSASGETKLAFYKPGTYYYRFRTVGLNQELSDWSDPEVFNVRKPLPPSAAPIRMAEKKQPTRRVANVEKKKKEVNKPVQRKLAAEPRPEIRTTKKLNEPLPSFNERYHNSVFSVQGFMWTLQSSQQYLANTEAPVASGLGLRYLRWWDRSGVEGLFRTQVVGFNQTGRQTALRDFEARYHFRFLTGFPFHLARELQTSFFAGFENHSNNGADFSNHYDLLTFGTSLEFPVANHWATGGELVYGRGLDQSYKAEIGGHLSYFWEKAWSASLGYRLHLFQAGATAAAPYGLLPYREGYTEGYTTINYHF